MEVCPKCGLPKDLCVCEVLQKEGSKVIKVSVDKAKFGKLVTVVEGVDKEYLKKTLKELKSGLACGGTLRDDVIILQGDHRKRIKALLMKLGYPEQSINIS
ncbi:MAG: stress response translation initiation inhibitor YciH [Candidatus Anstonellales archaeon]